MEDLSKTYNERLIAKAGEFRKFHRQNITRISRLSVSLFYFSRAEHVFETLLEPVATLKTAATRLFPNSSVQFEFVGAAELLTYSRSDKTKTFELATREGPLAVSEGGFIALISLSDYFKFVTDENQNRRRHLFLSNVRDYEGSVEVNRAIGATLRGESPEDFWVLNNGVTLLAVAARPGFKSLVLDDPVIVNGLQTTMEIIQHFRRRPGADDRMLLLRVVIPQSDKSRDRIIVATNSQTAIGSGTLRATDEVHGDIEQFFEQNGLFYERRRNSHRNEGRPVQAVITMPYLGRCLASVLLQMPWDAVKINAPTQILRKNDLYHRMFDPRNPLKLYLNAVLIVKAVEDHLGSDLDLDVGTAFEGRSKQGGRYWWMVWHLACYVAQSIVAPRTVSARSIAELDIRRVDEAILRSAVLKVAAMFKEVSERVDKNSYQVARGSSAKEPFSELLAEVRRAARPAAPIADN
jgi:hypothetical protein